jgi:O-antigen/teichoic acid export membrane protein
VWTAGVTAGLAAVVLAASTLAAAPFDGVVRWAAVAAPALAVLAVQGEFLKGAGRAVAGAALQSALNPALTLAIVLVVRPSTAGGVLAAVAGGTALAIVVTDVARRSWGARVVTPGADRWRPARSGPFLAAALWQLGVVWMPVLALGMVGGGDGTAQYFAADRLAQVASMLLVAVGGVLGPEVAARWADGDVAAVRRSLRRVTRWSAAVAGAFGLVAIAASEPLLGLFGDGYGDAATVLRFLAVGQVVVLATGPVSIVATMIGEERLVHWAGAVGVLVQGTLLAALVPRHGATGAAAATAVGLAVNKIAVGVVVRRRLHARGAN